MVIHPFGPMSSRAPHPSRSPTSVDRTTGMTSHIPEQPLDFVPGQLPPKHGLYDPRFEHDACGVSFVAHIKGIASHELVRTGLDALCNLEHRGATGAEADTGDGAGILVQVPDRFLRGVLGVTGRPSRGRSLRRRPRLPARRPDEGGEGAVGDRGASSPRRACGPRLARRARRPGMPRRHGPGGDAVVPAAVRHRPGGRRRASTSTARRTSPASASSTSSPTS